MGFVGPRGAVEVDADRLEAFASPSREHI